MPLAAQHWLGPSYQPLVKTRGETLQAVACQLARSRPAKRGLDWSASFRAVVRVEEAKNREAVMMFDTSLKSGS